MRTADMKPTKNAHISLILVPLPMMNTPPPPTPLLSTVRLISWDKQRRSRKEGRQQGFRQEGCRQEAGGGAGDPGGDRQG